MGRRRQSNFDDPPRFHNKGKTWYHVSGSKPRVWRKLSSNRAEALRLWAQLEGVKEDDSTRTFSVTAKRYVREVYPTKAVRTRKDNDKELAQLLRVFGHMPIDAILRMHIREYMDLRGQTAKVRANREKALFSHMFNKAREWGYTAAQNPCKALVIHQRSSHHVGKRQKILHRVDVRPQCLQMLSELRLPARHHLEHLAKELASRIVSTNPIGRQQTTDCPHLLGGQGETIRLVRHGAIVEIQRHL